MKVGIVGAGAIGGWMAVKLARGGCELSVLARGATLDAVRQHGLRLESARPAPGDEGASAAAPVHASDSAANARPAA